MLLAAHQPDLLPYTGFWYKMAMADVFDLAVHDQFQAKGYQRRVMMGGSWASIPVVGKPRMVPITEVRLGDDATAALSNVIIGRYRSAPLWKKRGDDVLEMVRMSEAEMLSEFNVSLITRMRDYLGIKTPLKIVGPPRGRGIDGLIDVCRQHGATEYLSGVGGMAYMGDEPEKVMLRAGVRLHWSKHQMTSNESILTTLFTHHDVMSVVLKEMP